MTFNNCVYAIGAQAIGNYTFTSNGKDISLSVYHACGKRPNSKIISMNFSDKYDEPGLEDFFLAELLIDKIPCTKFCLSSKYKFNELDIPILYAQQENNIALVQIPETIADRLAKDGNLNIIGESIDWKEQ